MNPQAIGIDIGTRAITVAHHDGPPISLSLKFPTWANDLAALIQPGAVVALEPTGWFYSRPIIRAAQAAGARVLFVEHSLTGQIRTAHISKAKTDRTDARALQWIAAHHDLTPYKGVTEVTEHQRDTDIRLRVLVHQYMKQDNHITRANNRMKQYAFSIHPALAHSWSTYQRAVQHGYITPDELRQLAHQIRDYNSKAKAERGQHCLPTNYRDGRTSRTLLKLVESLPTWLHDDSLRDLILRQARLKRLFTREKKELLTLIQEVLTTEPYRTTADLWRTVPNHSDAWIAAILAATYGNVSTIPHDQWQAAVGVHPKLSQSGESVQSQKSRPGFKHAKSALHLWTLQLLSPTSPPNAIKDTFTRHKARNHKGALYAARAKLADILYGIARTKTNYTQAKG